jgi:beta-glucanase (GH16 family)
MCPIVEDQMSNKDTTPFHDWSLVWADNFDGPAGSPVDAATWQPEVGGRGVGNDELQYYTDTTENAALDGVGNLAIMVRQTDEHERTECFDGCRYTSARLITKDRVTCRYGFVEARIQLPGGNGIWPAFWMLGHTIDAVGWPQCGEIDVMENFGFDPTKVQGTVHGPGYAGQDGIAAVYTSPTSLAAGFHRYAVHWEPGKISWYVDDTLYHTVTPRDLDGHAWVFDHDFYLLINVAVGGRFSQPPDATVSFPQILRIDYIRIYAPPSNSVQRL